MYSSPISAAAWKERKKERENRENDSVIVKTIIQRQRDAWKIKIAHTIYGDNNKILPRQIDCTIKITYRCLINDFVKFQIRMVLVWKKKFVSAKLVSKRTKKKWMASKLSIYLTDNILYVFNHIHTDWRTDEIMFYKFHLEL